MSLWRLLGRAAYWLAWPALFVYLRRGARTRVLVLAEDRVLLVQGWMSDGRWGLPGGGLHRHEAPEAGAVRETAEETGVLLQPRQLQRLAGEWCSQDGLRFYCHFYVTRLDAQAAVRRQRGEIMDVRWVPLSELQGMPHTPGIDRVLELLAAAG